HEWGSRTHAWQPASGTREVGGGFLSCSRRVQPPDGPVARLSGRSMMNLSLTAARALHLAAQGLDEPPAAPARKEDVLAAIRRLVGLEAGEAGVGASLQRRRADDRAARPVPAHLRPARARAGGLGR